MTLKSSPSGIFIAAPVLRSTGVHLGEKIVSLILWAIKLFELTMGAHIIWRLKKVLKYLCFCSSHQQERNGCGYTCRATRCGRHLSHERCGVTTAMVAIKRHT
ncbi:uncharacterized protein LOC125575223 isoform X3 [Brassica napus]|uniref:uncharacterized protein LOC125575223 isoform X3 n=1 Tax=Brassica napus TaxID=3708 RepID=UPI0020794851|nr:uncharacterized protein LOC125575223 isoform X3 [Brassica napus]